MGVIRQLFSHRVRALIRKELNQIKRDRRLALSLILPPVLQLTLFGFALSATVSNLRLGVIDDSRTPESRELIARLSESKSFRLARYYFSVDELGDAISKGDLDAGGVIQTYNQQLRRDALGLRAQRISSSADIQFAPNRQPENPQSAIRNPQS